MSDEIAFRYRFMAEIQEDTAAWQEANGLDNSKAKERARALRVKADLVEQGVPEVATSLNKAP